VHARRSPKRVGPAHVAEAGTVSTHYGVGFNNHEDLHPVGPEPAQEHPKATVQIRQARPFDRALEHGELLPKSEILERE